MSTILIVILILLLLGALPLWPQLGMGILPERWTRAHRTNPDYPGADRAAVIGAGEE